MALGVFLILLGGAFIGLVLRSYSNVMTNQHPKFTRDTSANGVIAGAPAESADSTDDPSFGPVQATVTVVEFGDYQCPYSQEAFPIVRRIMTEYSDRVRFVYRDFPVLDSHPLADYAAEAGQCAWEQGSNQFWALHDRMFAGQASLSEGTVRTWAQLSGASLLGFDTCVAAHRFSSEVQADYGAGLALGVRGTPTFFVNERKLEGVIPYETFRQIIDRELASD